MKRYYLIIAVVLALVLVVSGAHAKKDPAYIHSLVQQTEFDYAKFKRPLVTEDTPFNDAAPYAESKAINPNEEPFNDVAPYIGPDAPDVSVNRGVGEFKWGIEWKPIRWFMLYKALEASD